MKYIAAAILIATAAAAWMGRYDVTYNEAIYSRDRWTGAEMLCFPKRSRGAGVHLECSPLPREAMK